MRQLDLKEYEGSGPVRLSITERDTLREVLPSVTVEPVSGVEGEYRLTPGAIVGAVEISDLSVLIRPKIGILKLLSLACYAMGVYKPQELRLFDFKEEEALPDVLARALAAAARRAFSRGLLHGYRTEEEALSAVRGRIRFDEQLRRRFGVPVPIEVRYDEFTDDILVNRLVKAATARLGGMRLRSPEARRGLGRVAGMLDNVAPVEFSPSAVPEVTFDRLNEHYRGVVGLSRLILRHSAFESSRGEVRASGFLMDMNKVFQEFLTVALREALGVSSHTFGEYTIPSLDKGGLVHLRPDLVWRDGRDFLFVGDAKYKRIRDERVPNADLYQLLAYATALALPGGLLVYAKGEEEPVVHEVRDSGKRLQVAALDLSGTFDEVLRRVESLANKVAGLRDEARSLLRAA